MSAVTGHRICMVQGRTISYREAGDVSAPAILLLHGLPGSSAEYDTLICALADKFHLIAPDYIGFGVSEAPEPGVFAYTFENLTDYVAGLIAAIAITKGRLLAETKRRPHTGLITLEPRTYPGYSFAAEIVNHATWTMFWRIQERALDRNSLRLASTDLSRQSRCRINRKQVDPNTPRST